MPLAEAASVALPVVPLPILLLDAEGRITDANDMAQGVLGTSVRRLAGKHLASFIAPDIEIKAMLERVARGETLSDDSFCMRGNHAPIALHIGPDDSLADGCGFIAILVPEANRSEVEQQVRRHEMAEAVARIALEMAHEVKNPLAALRGAAQWLAEHSSSGDTGEIAEHMLGEIDRIRERIDAFLQVGPRAEISMSAVNIHALIDNVCRAPDGVQMHRVYDPSLPPLLAHETRLRQAIENLWSNALEAGSTMIEWQTRIAPLVSLPDHTGLVLEVRITSNGNPIPDEIRERLFEPYVTNKQRGSGLGLAIVQRVVQEHGGRVSLQTDFGRTAFVLHLPIRQVAD
jgi:two-component system nitrogen regulation sensor histidine kinase GlnL